MGDGRKGIQVNRGSTCFREHFNAVVKSLWREGGNRIW